MTLPFSARDAAKWTGGELLQGDPDTQLQGVSIDSRAVASGLLFVAIRGPQHDAHAYLGDAVTAGAGGLLIARDAASPPQLEAGLPVIAVPDTTRALGALAAGHRSGHRGPVVAITGSSGKTTTKEMCAAILSIHGPCLANEGNLNNQYGLPLTLLKRDARHRVVVVELGMNHRGEISVLAAMAAPTVGVITNVGSAHIENLGSHDAIALEKGDLVSALRRDGVAVLNADDPRLPELEQRTAARVLRFGLGPSADVRAETVNALPGHGFGFRLVAPEGSVDVEVAGLAEATVQNALAATAAALAAGASLEGVREGLASHRPPQGRLTPIPLPGGGIVIDDSYNANPESLEVALRTLVGSGGRTEGRAIAVLGDMGELGEKSEAAHREAGRRVAQLGIERLFAFGDRAAWLIEGACEAGMPSSHISTDTDAEQLGARLTEELRDGDVVLVKGSRAMRMERIVAALLKRGSQRA